jgi:hypothetical protein
MPMKTYRVVHNGVEYTRRTERIYTHLVLVRRDYEAELKSQILMARERAWDDHPFFVREANPQTRVYKDITPETLALYEHAASLTREQFADEQGEQARARVEERRAKGVFDTLGALTWCGRPDLAMKEEAKARATGYWAEVVVLPVPQP